MTVRANTWGQQGHERLRDLAARLRDFRRTGRAPEADNAPPPPSIPARVYRQTSLWPAYTRTYDCSLPRASGHTGRKCRRRCSQIVSKQCSWSHGPRPFGYRERLEPARQVIYAESAGRDPELMLMRPRHKRCRGHRNTIGARIQVTTRSPSSARPSKVLRRSRRDRAGLPELHLKPGALYLDRPRT
jgi:hypothetical protein